MPLGEESSEVGSLEKRRVNVCAQMQVTQSIDIKRTDDWSDLTKQMHASLSK